MLNRILIPWKESGDAGVARVTEYLSERGFRRKGFKGDQEIFQRGSILGNLTSFNMRNILTNVYLYRKGDFLVAKYNITGFGQAFSENDIAFFNLECSELESVGLGGERVPTEIWEDYEESARGGWGKLLRTLALPLLVVAIVGGTALTKSGSFGREGIPLPSGDSSTHVTSGSPAVYLVPFDGFPEMMAQNLASWLSQDTGVFVKAMPAAAMDFAHFNEFRNQHAAESFYEGMRAVAKRLPERTEKTAVIFITDKDIYLESANFRFVFSSHWDGRLSIVGTGRYGTAGTEMDNGNDTFEVRTLKLLKRTIGLQYFEYGRASDPDRIMYSPIAGIPDIDRIDLTKW